MRYIWIISDIYRTPSAILHPPKGRTSPPSPGPLKVLRPSLPRIAQEFIKGP